MNETCEYAWEEVQKSTSDDITAKLTEHFKEQSESILQEAERLVNGPRKDDYGAADVCCDRIAAVWSAILGIKVTGEQVCLCMAGMKIIRECQGGKRDNLVDIAGYAQVLQNVKDAR